MKGFWSGCSRIYSRENSNNIKHYSWVLNNPCLINNSYFCKRYPRKSLKDIPPGKYLLQVMFPYWHCVAQMSLTCSNLGTIASICWVQSLRGQGTKFQVDVSNLSSVIIRARFSFLSHVSILAEETESIQLQSEHCMWEAVKSSKMIFILYVVLANRWLSNGKDMHSKSMSINFEFKEYFQ